MMVVMRVRIVFQNLLVFIWIHQISVMDYASKFYPSSMRSENLSHDSIITEEKYMGDEGINFITQHMDMLM